MHLFLFSKVRSWEIQSRIRLRNHQQTMCAAWWLLCIAKVRQRWLYRKTISCHSSIQVVCGWHLRFWSTIPSENQWNLSLAKQDEISLDDATRKEPIIFSLINNTQHDLEIWEEMSRSKKPIGLWLGSGFFLIGRTLTKVHFLKISLQYSTIPVHAALKVWSRPMTIFSCY